MPGNTVEPTEQDFQQALSSLMVQVKAHNVEMTPEFHSFLLHQSSNEATHSAWMRFYQNIIHAPVFENAQMALDHLNDK